MLNSFRLFLLVAFSIGAYFTFNDHHASHKSKRAPTSSTQYQTQCASAGQIALTFDGGPHNANTPAVLDVLQAANVKATFHISTQWISQQLTGAIVRRIQSEGHVVGLRYIPNGNLTTMTIAQVRQDLIDQSMAIYRVINSFPRYIRMPFGQTTAEIDSLITDMGFTATNWNIDSEDYRLCQNTGNYTVAQMVEKYTSEFVRFQNAGNLKGAFIALQSDLCAIRDGVDGVLKSIRDYAYTAVTLDTCFGHGTAYKYAADSFGNPPSGGGGNTRPSTSQRQTTSSTQNQQPTQPIGPLSASQSSVPSVLVSLVAFVATVVGLMM